MSDQSQGPGWWQAADGKWYSPEQAPGAQPPTPGGSPQGPTIDIGAALSYGWNGFVKNLGTILVLLLIIIVAYAGFGLVGQLLVDNPFLSIVFSVIGYVIALMVTVGLIRASLEIVEGRTPEFDVLFQGAHVGSYFVASLLVGLMTFVGLVLCVIPGLLVMFFTFFYGYYIVDKNMSPTDGISASVNVVRANMGNLLAFLVVAVVLLIVTCGLAWPVVWIAGAYVYKTINGEPVAALV